MKLLHDAISFVRRIGALAGRRRRARALQEEVDFHLAMRQREYEEAGASAEAARQLARQRFGNVTALTERTDDMWRFPSFESFVQDVRYALRSLIRTPGFSLVALLMLAIGIGANTAMFSLVDSMLLRGLPYADPDRLVLLIGNVQRTQVERRGNSLPDHNDWRARSTLFEDMAAYTTSSITVAGDGVVEPERVTFESVTSPYFSLLGIAPAYGRTFRADEDSVTDPAYVVMLSDGLWRRRFGADPSIVNKTVLLSGRSYYVAGIMPPGFTGITDSAQVWLPWGFGGYGDNRGSRGFNTLARLKPGVTMAAAQAEMAVISAQLASAYPATNEKRAVEISPLLVETLGQLKPIMLALMTAVSFVLLIACANVANLLIGRSEARQREIAVRSALGAGQARLFRQLVTESCVLTILGAAAGLALASALMRGIVATSPVQFPTYVQPALNVTVLLFAIGVALCSGLVLGLAPALHARKARLTDALKESARGSGSARSHRMRGVLVVTEIALAIVLFIGAALMIRSSQQLAAVDPGFDTSGMLTVTVSVPRQPAPATGAPPPPGQTPPPPPPYLLTGKEILERVRAVPGVTDAALVTEVPLTGNGGAVFYSAEGDATTDAQTMPRAYIHRVSGEFFKTMRMPIKAGRTFIDTEFTATSPAIIVSENVTKRFWAGQDPIGKRIKFGPPASTNPWLTIVGVVPETKFRALPANPTEDPDLYLPALDRSPQPVLIRTSLPPGSIQPQVRSAIRQGQPAVAVFAAQTMDELVATQTSASRFTMWVLGLFAVTALVLSAIGVYGVMSYLVTQRWREFSIRLALGASRRDIIGVVVGHGARLVAIGAAIGIAAAIALGQVFASALYGVTTFDVSSIGAIVVLVGSALLACVIPAFRVTRVHPATALRS